MEPQAQIKNTWTHNELIEEFRVLARTGRYVRVKRRSDAQEGVMEVKEDPTIIYFDFVPDEFTYERKY